MQMQNSDHPQFSVAVDMASQKPKLHVNQLKRSLYSCMLWEKEHYEDGLEIAERLGTVSLLVAPGVVSDMAIEVRRVLGIRHAALWLAVCLATRDDATDKNLIARTIGAVIQQPDDLGEFLSLWDQHTATGEIKATRQVKRGLAAALRKFDGHQLAKYYKRPARFTIADVIKLCHPKPAGPGQSQLWKAVIEKKLPPPYTWEATISESTDRKASWEKLLSDAALDGLALLRHLRAMRKENVEASLIRDALSSARWDARTLPDDFFAAALEVPEFEPDLEEAMRDSLPTWRLHGITVVLVDVSESMERMMSERSKMSRLHAACSVAMAARELCPLSQFVTFASRAITVPPRRGFALRDTIISSQAHSGRHLRAAIDLVNTKLEYDRLIVITDEEIADEAIPEPRSGALAYMINVGRNLNGVGYGRWTRIDGFSGAIMHWMYVHESGR